MKINKIYAPTLFYYILQCLLFLVAYWDILFVSMYVLNTGKRHSDRKIGKDSTFDYFNHNVHKSV